MIKFFVLPIIYKRGLQPTHHIFCGPAHVPGCFIYRAVKVYSFCLLFLFFFEFIRSKLEFFEQACSVDSVTKKCAGRPSSCRQALLGILGTVLRTTCACQGADQQFLYRCLGWRKLLWVNPCVGKY